MYFLLWIDFYDKIMSGQRKGFPLKEDIPFSCKRQNASKFLFYFEKGVLRMQRKG